jgi:hypothetical protein
MSKSAELKAVLERLETSTQKLLQTRGYSKDVKSLKALEEMIRDQLKVPLDQGLGRRPGRRPT